MSALEYMERQVVKHRANFERESARGCPATMMADILLKIGYYEAAANALRNALEVEGNAP